jgi:hypothetical protein
VEAVVGHLVVGLGLVMEMEGLEVVVVGSNMLSQAVHQVGSPCLCIARFAWRTRKCPCKLSRSGTVWEMGWDWVRDSG